MLILIHPDLSEQPGSGFSAHMKAIAMSLEATSAHLQTLEIRLTEGMDKLAALVDQLNAGLNELKGITCKVLGAIEIVRMMTLRCNACSLALLVGGMVGSIKNNNR